MSLNPGNSKGQAAMEFLMTYGWAILAVLLVIAVLTYFGVPNAENLVPDRCSMTPPFTCADFKVSDPGTVAFSIANNGGGDVQIFGVNVSGTGILGFCTTTTTPSSYPVTLARGGEQLFVVTPCTFAASVSKKNKYTMLLTYSNSGSVNVKTVQGDILSKREG
ncbi:MAG: hypothetical protein EPN86_03275 [Nanoarchaeota archaeon]|nr:MAG: hypothetical protein EPN86_03275 [Nanoarchaeota archaeon]